MQAHPIVRVTLGAGLAWLFSAGICSAQPAHAKLPDGLRFVPPDALGFVHVRVGDFLQREIGQDLLKRLRKDRDASAGLKEVEGTLGIEVAGLESITVIMPAPMPLPAGFGPGRFGPGKPGRPIELEPKRDFEFEKKFEKPPFKDELRFKDKEEPRFKDEPRPKQDFDDKKEEATFPISLVQPMAENDFVEMGQVFAAGPLVVLTATKALDRKKILRAQLMSMKARNPFAGGHEPSVLFLSDRSIIVGRPEQLAHYTDELARRPLPKARLDHALALAAEPHLIIAGGHLPASVRRMLPMDNPVFTLAGPLLVTDAAVALDVGKGFDVTLSLKAPTEASAGVAMQALKNLATLGEMVLETPQRDAGGMADLHKAVSKALANVAYDQKETTVHARVKVDADPVLIQHAVSHAFAAMQKRAGRTQSINNLKQMALAMLSYHDAYKALPPAGISSINDPKGKPILSWRVAILPYIDEAPLYNKFDLTKPWDDPVNKKLIPLMPKIYMIPGVDAKEGMTHYRVLVGPQTAFEPGQRITMVGITDGTSNTIMAVEAAEPTIWTRPDDLPFDPKGALPKFGVSPDGFLAAFCDGTVRFVPASMPAANIRALITRNGGEIVELPDTN